MSNTGNYAKEELRILVESHTDPDNRPIIEEFIPEILALVNKFGESGQSGGSAPYVASALSQAIKHLCLQEPICPITGIASEWSDISSYHEDSTIYQNKRCSAIFKDRNNKAYYIDAIVWKDEKDNCWNGSAKLNGTSISSGQYIKSFPFTPKTFYIDIISEEVEKDVWEFYVKDENQLKEVFEYYDEFNFGVI